MDRCFLKVKMEDVCEITSSKRIYVSDYIDNGIPFYRGKEIIEKQKGLVDISTKLFITEEKYHKIKDKFGVPEKGDLLLTSVGTLGVPYVVKQNDRFYFKDGNLVWFRKLKNIVSRYLYYWILSPMGRAELKKCTIGASQAAFTIVLLKSIEIVLPPLKVQNKIATILSAYDDLIEINLRRIKILEEMAQNLYREWFVNFRFPGHENTRFVDSPLGKIPEGWEVKSLGEVTKNYDKLRKPLSSMDRAKRKGIYPYYGAAKVIDYIDDYIFDGKYLLIAEDGSVVTNEQKPVLQYVDGKFWANNHVHILKGKGYVTTEHLYLSLYDTNISGYITGAAQPKISQANLNRIPFIVPTESIAVAFGNIVSNIFQLKMVFNKTNEILRRTRDLLLPKLISGGVDVSDLDINVPEEVAI